MVERKTIMNGRFAESKVKIQIDFYSTGADHYRLSHRYNNFIIIYI